MSANDIALYCTTVLFGLIVVAVVVVGLKGGK